MTDQSNSGSDTPASATKTPAAPARLRRKHLLGIEGLNPLEINELIDRGNMFADLLQQGAGLQPPLSEALRGCTVLNLFFENSTRTRVSFELAAKNLGASVLNINVAGSSVKKGETLLDTATTLNAMHPHILVVRHNCAGAVVPDHQNMRMHGVQRRRRIKQRFALLHRGSGHIDIENGRAEIFCGKLERNAGACRVFEEQVQDGATAKRLRQGRLQPGALLQQVGKHVAAVDQLVDLERVQPFNTQQMLASQPRRRGWCFRCTGRGV